MTHDEIIALSRLARIRLTEEEVQSLRGEFDAILGYVANIEKQELSQHILPVVPPHANILRPDEVTVPSGTHTETLLGAAPRRHKNYVEVKKIIGGGSQ